MLELVTVDDARQQLRLDFDSSGGPDDAWLALAIPGVSEAVAGWLKTRARLYVPQRDSDGAIVLDSDGEPVPLEDSNGDPIVHATVRLAVLVELDRQYRFRDGSGDGDVPADAGHGYALGRGATSLLSPLRRSTVR